MGRKLGALPFFGEGAGSHLTQSRLDWGLPPYQVASWCIQPFGHNKNGPKIQGALPPFWGGFWGGEQGPHLTQSPGPRPTSVPSGILIHAAIWLQHTWVENGAVLLFFLGGSWVPIYHDVAWAEVYLCTKWHLNPASSLATTDIGRNLGGVAPFGERELCPHLTQCGLGWGLPPCQVSSQVIYQTV